MNENRILNMKRLTGLLKKDRVVSRLKKTIKWSIDNQRLFNVKLETYIMKLNNLIRNI
jgi:hypothetical protein